MLRRDTGFGGGIFSLSGACDILEGLGKDFQVVIDFVFGGFSSSCVDCSKDAVLLPLRVLFLLSRNKEGLDLFFSLLLSLREDILGFFLCSTKTRFYYNKL